MKTIDIHHPLLVCRSSAGTGKTFTLAAYYIAMLLSGESHRNILAVTFTNAATAEMKERILTYLLGISEGREQEFVAKVREFMLRDEDADDSVLQSRARANLHAILQDYDNFSVTTIDSFLQQLIRGLAKAINRTADFAINLDAEQVITAAVDTMLTSELSDESKQTVYEYVEQCIGESKGWDIRRNLIRIAMQLYKESVQVQSAVSNQKSAIRNQNSEVSGLDLDTTHIAAYRSALYAKRTAMLNEFRAMAQQAKSDMDSGVAYATGKNAKTAIDNMFKSVTEPEKMDNDKLFRGATDNGMNDIQSDPQLRALQQACDKMREVYWQTTYSLTYLNDMRLMRALEDSIERSLLRTNTALLAETAITLAAALQPGDADFILEKAGIRYRHIMIDEFQDTSLLQWQVFLHLIEEIASVPGQTILIVGDAKQSIYRFRNGNWQIMEGLGKTQLQAAYNHNTRPLIRNQRSREQVVRFNLGVMQQVAGQSNLQIPVSAEDKRPIGKALYDELTGDNGKQADLQDYYRADKHQGGYVRCRFYPYYDKRSAKSLGTETLLKEPQQQALWDDVCATIEELLESGERPQDILVLGRLNVEIQQWAAYCREQGERYPLLSRTEMVSRDSFQLESCVTIQLLIAALRYLHTGSEAAGEFVSNQISEVSGQHGFADRKKSDIRSLIAEIDKRAPLYDQLQRLLQIIGCEQGIYQGDDVAYVNCFLDDVQQFIAAYGSDVQALLQYWDDTMHKHSISGDSSREAIRLMSVHSSKGLEGKTVIILDAGWYTEHDREDDILWSEAIDAGGNKLPYIPITQNKKLQLAGEHTPYYRVYKQEHEAQLIDNYNLLYVALTRAADNLYVYALIDAKKHTDGYPTVAASLLDYTGLREQLTTIVESENPYLAYTKGGEPHINQPGDGKRTGTFDYAGVPAIEARLYSDGSQVHFRQSQESTQYMQESDDTVDTDTNTEQIDFGLLCHDIFAHIARADEAQQVIDNYREQGLIASDEQYNKISTLIRQALSNEQMQQWFDGSWQLMREATILSPAAIIRPDRVMIRGDKAVVLDYKFTNQHRKSYTEQVRDYMSALERIGYKQVEGWLWFAYGNRLERVNG